MEKPIIVSSHDIHIDKDYSQWIYEVKQRYRQSQIKATIKVNSEKLLFNWLLGRDLMLKKIEERWGSGVVEQVSIDLKREFPQTNGFSTSNLWYMKKWYQFYTERIDEKKLQQVVGELQYSINQSEIKLQQVVGEIEKEKITLSNSGFPLLFSLISWGHHIEIITHCQTIEEALFYIRQTIERDLSRNSLKNCIKSNLYSHQGKILNNFTDHLSQKQSKLVQEVLKENYDFGFANVEHANYDETALEEALTRNITDLLLEMGNGFAFVGRQKELIVGGRSRKIDLLFYHFRLRCYVVCELKAVPFEPEFAGKLNFYVNAVDELLKQDEDNPTIGLLICSDLNKTEVQWSFHGISTPMGVATYNNIKIKDILPSQELLKERVELLQKELKEAKRIIQKNDNKTRKHE